MANAFHGVKVIRVNNQTVQFQLEKADINLLNFLNLGILPAHLWSEIPETSATLAEMNLKPVGSGPYQAASFTRDSKGSILTYHLRAFPEFYGPPSYIRDWNFRFYSDRFQAQNALRGNQVDALAFIPWGEMSAVKNKNFQSVRLELPQETIVFFHVKNAPFKDERVRRALAMAVDPQELQTLIGPHATPIHSPFPFFETTTGTPSDLEKARALLQSAGWQLKDGETLRHLTAPTPPGLPTKRGAKTPSPPTTANVSSTAFVFTIDVPNQPDLLKVADFLKRRWSLLGAQVNIHAEEADPLLRDVVGNRSYQVLLWNILLPEDQDLTPFWSSNRTGERGLNLSNLEDRDVDLALEAVKSATS
ncbi:MAG: ABC transporter substrate-binding protein, partial [Candidatus Uhrbacteria bacterium]|nr:ABC transporter substrate-binding protein [Candidatus Uhrbacteria bacterium]